MKDFEEVELFTVKVSRAGYNQGKTTEYIGVIEYADGHTKYIHRLDPVCLWSELMSSTNLDY